MKRLLLLSTILLSPLVSGQNSNYILLQCPPSPFDNNHSLIISINKSKREANYEKLRKGYVIETGVSLPVEFTATTIKITDEYSIEKMKDRSFPKNMTFTSQMRISRRTLILQTYGSVNGDIFVENSTFGTEIGGVGCSLVKSNNLGNQI